MVMIRNLFRLGRRQLHTIVSREIIKPSSPTPSIHNTYNLSEVDQLIQHKYVPLAFLYPNNRDCGLGLSSRDKATILKQSLSQTLSKYYPFAGRLHTPVKPTYIDCNDEGVVFVEAKNNSELTALFQHQHDETLEQLFPNNLVGCNSPQSNHVVGVQLNHFACGGVALAVPMSHAVVDGCAISYFLNHWASVARYGSTDHKEVLPLNPHFLNSVRTDSVLPEPDVINIPSNTNWTMRKFVFPNSKLSDLKNKVNVKKPTRVEVLTSLLYKTALKAATTKFGCFQPSYLFSPVNMRSKFVPKLPQTTVGNLGSAMLVPIMSEGETSLSFLVSKIKKEKLQLEEVQSVQHAAEKMKMLFSKLGNVAKRPYICSSICGFPFGKMDFGWGKPMGITGPFIKATGDVSTFLLYDTPHGDGIEAMVILDKDEMEIFENDKEMLSFCQINNNV